MSKKLIIAILLLVCFALGLLIGNSEILQKAARRFKKKETLSADTFEKNPSAYIHIHDTTDVTLRRDSLIKYIWKSRGFPSDKMPAGVEKNISDPGFDKLENLKQIDKLTIIMEHDVQSIIYLFQPEKPNGKLMVYHHGHVTGFDRGKNVIQYFLKNNFSVLACSMPLCGMNNKPVVVTEFGTLQLLKHPDFQFLDTKDFSSMHYFLEPVATALNYLDKNFRFESYSMIGVSGGGWTTVFYSAIDERIKHSYSVAGSAPFFLRSGSRGDYEQALPDVYRIADYFDLYILAAHGNNRKFVQVFNKYDPCCFSGDKYRMYEKDLTNAVKDIGEGSFEMWIDEKQKKHDISEDILKQVIVNLNK